MTDLLFFLLGAAVGSSVGVFFLSLRNYRLSSAMLDEFDFRLKGLIAEHDEIVRGLITRMKGMEAEHAGLVDAVEAGDVVKLQ